MASKIMSMRSTGVACRPASAGRVSAAPFLPQIRRTLVPLVNTKPQEVPVVCEAASLPVPGVTAPPATWEKYVELGAYKAKLSPLKTFIFSIVAGCYIAWGALLALSVGGMCPGLTETNPGLQKILLGSFGLPFGLLLVLNCGAELFTGNTALVTAAVLENKATTGDLIKSWSLSFIGNLIGALLMVALLSISGFAPNGAATTVAAAKTSLPFMQAFVRGMLANWLVCLAIFMATASTTLPGKVLGVWLPISSFVVMGFEHSVANMFFIPWGAAGAGITFMHFIKSNLIPVTLGNIVGGAVCVAFAYAFFFGKLGNGK